MLAPVGVSALSDSLLREDNSDPFVYIRRLAGFLALVLVIDCHSELRNMDFRIQRIT
jgi:hypothetical protein